jgi:hypothetical protein
MHNYIMDTQHKVKGKLQEHIIAEKQTNKQAKMIIIIIIVIVIGSGTLCGNWPSFLLISRQIFFLGWVLSPKPAFQHSYRIDAFPS